MPITKIEIGTIPNDGHGDTLRTAGEKINAIIDVVDDHIDNHPAPPPAPEYAILHATIAGNNPVRQELIDALGSIPFVDTSFDVMDYSNPTKMWTCRFSATVDRFYIEKMLDV